jgi:hypothetical protein
VAVRWAAQEAHRRRLVLRIVTAAGLDAMLPAATSESFWSHVTGYQESWANGVVNEAADLARRARPRESAGGFSTSASYGSLER